MSNDLYKQIYNYFNSKETDELVEIWKTNDRVEWSEAAFDAIKEILEQRLIEFPSQNEPIFDKDKKGDIYDENTPFDKYTDPTNAPILYKPKEVLWMNYWLNRIAIPAIVITVIVSVPELFRTEQLANSIMGNPEWDFLAWLIAIVIGGLAISLQCAFVYISLKALAFILKIHMEMEFNSRGVK